MSTVRENLLTRLGYSPYCGAERCRGHWPRTSFNGSQFKCSACGWTSGFEPEFIEKYKKAQEDLKGVVEVRFRTYSAKNPDADAVLHENRLRGCMPGDPCIIWGPNIEISERRLRDLAEQYYQDGITVKNRRVGSFSILCDSETAKKIKAGFLE